MAIWDYLPFGKNNNEQETEKQPEGIGTGQHAPMPLSLPVNGKQYDIEAYMPQTGRIIGEDGRAYNLVDLLKSASFGGGG